MDNNKKILIVTPFFYPAWSYGGPPRVMFDLSTAISADNISVECITTDVFDKKRYKKKTDKINNIHVTYFKNASNYLAYYFKFFWPIGFKKYLKNNLHKFNVVHIADFRNLCTYHAYHQCIKQNIPYIIAPFGTMPYKKDFRGLIKWIIDRAWGISCLKNAKFVIVQTENERNEAIKLGVSPQKIKLIPLMINAKKFEIATAQKNDVRKNYNIPLSAKIIVFVGRINVHKATNQMLLAVAKLIQENPNYDFCLLIIGRDDGYEDQLKKLAEVLEIKDHIIFAGPIFYPDNVAIYKASDVFFMAPTHFEETSAASLEALASGIPVVVTEQADIPYFNEYEAGFVVKNELSKLATALKKVLVENKFKGDDCTKLIRENFDIEKIANKYKDIYFK